MIIHLSKEEIMNEIFIGVVKEGEFKLFLPKSALAGDARLTSIGMQEAVTPESGELNLTDSEGKSIAVQGHDGGGWIYEAEVIDIGGPIVTALVQQVLGDKINLK